MKAQRRFGHTWLLWLEPEENHVLNLAVDGFRAILLGSDDSTSGSVMEPVSYTHLTLPTIHSA